VSSSDYQEYQCQRDVNDVPVKEWRVTRFMVLNQRVKAIRNCVMLPWIAALASGSVADSNRQARPIETIKPIWSDDHLFLLFHVINIHWAA